MAGIPIVQIKKGFSPVSFAFIASGIAIKAKAKLYGMQPARTNEAPNWDGRGGDLQEIKLAPPITEPSYWQERYVLTELTLKSPDKDQPLVINDATVSVSIKKEIVKTSLVGLDGTIKEYINTGDWEIKVSVGIVAVNDGQIVDEYPEDGIREVKEFLDVNEAIEITSTFLDIFDVNRVVITEYSLKQETASNRQTLEFKAISDRDFQIECTEY